MNFQDVFEYFQNPPPIYLPREVAVCCILTILIDNGESYSSDLMQYIKTEYSPYRLSDTVLYNALKFLMNEGIITSYWKNFPGRGRPRRMLIIPLTRLDEASQLSKLWLAFLEKHNSQELPLITIQY